MAFTTGGVSQLLSSVNMRERRKFKTPPVADQKAYAEKMKKQAEAKKGQDNE